MEMQKVKSSNIVAVGYDDGSKKLRVQFASGTYEYSSVERQSFDEMMKAESVGKFFISNIRSNHEFKRIEENDDGK